MKELSKSMDDSGGIPSRESYVAQAIERAMSFRDHRAAITTDDGVGMVTAYRNDKDFAGGLKDLGIAAALLSNEGPVFVEHHAGIGIEGWQPDDSECHAYKITGDEGLVVASPFTKSYSPWNDGYKLDRHMKMAVGEGFIDGTVDTITEGRKIALELADLDHKIAFPQIEKLVYTAFRDLD